jgi:cysteine desulfurase
MNVLNQVDFLACSAHKFHGPKGIGFLYVNKKNQINPIIHGGAQERNMRGGTENVYGIVGLSKAMDVAFEGIEAHQEYVIAIKEYMISRLNESILDVSYNADSANMSKSLYTILSVSLPPTEIASMLLFNMDILGISCSGGSACTSGANIGSHVLNGIEAPMERPTIRFSFSRYTTTQEIDYAVNSLVSLYT